MNKQLRRRHRPPAIVGQVVLCIAVVSSQFTFVLPARAHEGHKPLPAKGVEVDIERGSVLLTKAARDALAVETAEVALESGEDRVLAYAKLVSPWQQHAFVSSQVSGRIVALKIDPGQSVVAGQSLAEIASPELENLQLELINANNALLLSQQLVEHYQSIGEGVVAGSKLQEALATNRDNINAVESARIKLLNLGFSNEQLTQLATEGESHIERSLQILSPISGIAYHTDLTIGKVIVPAEHLFEVVDLSSVWGKIEILERDLHKVAVGQTVEVTLPAYPDETFRGEIKVKEIYLDPETHLGTVWIDLENPAEKVPRLLPGMFGQAQVIIASPDKLLTIPASALARDGAERFVLVQEEATDKASQYIKHNVIVVREGVGKVQFRAEKVFPGDRVVTVGTHELFNFFVQGVLRLSPEAAANIGLRTEQVTTRDVGETFSIDGLVEFPSSGRDKISSQLPGVIEKVLVSRGQLVRKGDIVCELSSFEFQDLQLQLVTTQNDIGNLQTTLKRWEPLKGTAAIPQRQRWETESTLKSKQNQLENLNRKLQSIGMNGEQLESLIFQKTFLRSLPLRSNIDGYVVQFENVIGQFVAAGDPIMEVHNPAGARVRAFVSERELTQVRIQQSARVRFVAFPTFVTEAVITRSSQGFDSVNRTLSVWAEFPTSPTITLQHGMLTRLHLVSSQNRPVLAVSLDSVVSESSTQYVFVQANDGKFERRLVTTGRSDDLNIEITSGLKEDEQIAAWGVSELQSAYASLR